MNCQECQQHLLEYAYGELPHNLEREVAEALRECPTCQRELDEIGEVRSLLGEAMPPAELPNLARANILREARKQAAASAEAQQSSLWEQLSGLVFHPTFAVACAVLLVISVAIVFVDNDPAMETALDDSAAPALEASRTAPSEEVVAAAADDEPAAAELGDGETELALAGEKTERANDDGIEAEQKEVDSDELSLDGKLVADNDTPAAAPAKSIPVQLEPEAETGNRGRSNANVWDKSPGTRAKLDKSDDNNVGSVMNAGIPAGTKAEPLPFEGQTLANEDDELAVAADEPAPEKDKSDDSAGRAAYDEAMAAYKGGRYRDAEKKFDRYLSSAPTSSNYYAEALYRRGRAQLNTNNPVAAVRSFRQVLRSANVASARRAEAEYYLATALLRTDPNNEEAERILARLKNGGGGGVSSKAASDYARSFGKKGKKKVDKSRPARRKKNAPKKAMERYDYNEAPAPSSVTLE